MERKKQKKNTKLKKTVNVQDKQTHKQSSVKSCGIGIFPPNESHEFVQTNVDVEVLYEGESTIISLNRFLINKESLAWIQFAENMGFTLARHKQGNGIAHRDCGRIEFQSEETAEAIFNRLKPFVPQTYLSRQGSWELDSCASNIRIYKYSQGQRFGRHYDESTDIDKNRKTFYTVLVYLNGAGGIIDENQDKASLMTASLSGGATNFFLENNQHSPICSQEPLMNTLLFHEHGDRCLLHEGAQVTNGDKYLLRTDVVYKIC
mmetsp:Transcript_38306/g.49538  ORF Transcript_38306/g.49538 Transcript_38306/m.49538 type:complete len:262 (-) Transcript_38306:355-1140(-)